MAGIRKLLESFKLKLSEMGNSVLKHFVQCFFECLGGKRREPRATLN